MGIADVRTALKEAVGAAGSVQNVTLGYSDGGKKQVLRFTFKRNGDGAPGWEKKEYTFSGELNPIAEVMRIGRELADQPEENM